MFLGFGTCLRYYFDSHPALIPLFVDIRINFIEDDISPYLSRNAGYSFDASIKLQATGYLLNLIAGVSLMLSDKSAINIDLGYEMQRMKFYSYWSYKTLIKNSSAISFNFGVSFFINSYFKFYSYLIFIV